MAITSAFQPFIHPSQVCNRLIRSTVLYAAVGVCGVLIFGGWSYPVSAWLALILFGVFYLFLLRVSPGSALALFPPFYGVAFTQFISGILIESGGYLSETQEMGSPTGGFLRLAVIYILFMGTAAVVIERYLARWRQSGQVNLFLADKVRPFMPLAYAMNAMIILGLAYLVYVGIKNGFPLLTGIDRFQFAIDLEDPIYTSVMGNRLVAMAYIGFMLAVAPRRGLYRLIALSVLVMSALLGDKFTEYVIVLGQLAGPSLCRMAWSAKGLPLRRMVLLGIAIACITMPLVFVVYGGLSNSSASLDHMKERMTLQGQLWFLADREVHDAVRFVENPIVGELYMMIATEPTPKTARNKPVPYQGMAWMMLHFAPPSDAALRLKTGVVYCLGLHAYFLEILGWVGLVVLNFLTAALLGLILAGMLYSLVYGRLVYLLYFSKFLTFWTAGFVVADPFIILNWRSAVFLISLWLYARYDKRFNFSALSQKFLLIR